MRPVILLPESGRAWDEARLRAVLLHESAHVRRRDCFAKYTAQASRALLWWNPLAWTMAARLDQEQERACDEAVLSAGVTPEDYARALLDTARECSSSFILVCAMSSSSLLRSRLEQLFEWRGEAIRAPRRSAVAIPLLLVLMTSVSFAEKIYKVGPGITAPKVLEKTDIAGIDERAHDIKITKSLDPGLDASAINSILNWRFQPGTKNGKPVPVQAKIEVNFRLH